VYSKLHIYHLFPQRALHHLIPSPVVNRAKFYLSQIRGFDSVGSNFWLSDTNEMSQLTQGLNYRSTCDKVKAHLQCVKPGTVLAMLHWTRVFSPPRKPGRLSAART